VSRAGTSSASVYRQTGLADAKDAAAPDAQDRAAGSSLVHDLSAMTPSPIADETNTSATHDRYAALRNRCRAFEVVEICSSCPSMSIARPRRVWVVSMITRSCCCSPRLASLELNYGADRCFFPRLTTTNSRPQVKRCDRVAGASRCVRDPDAARPRLRGAARFINHRQHGRRTLLPPGCSRRAPVAAGHGLTVVAALRRQIATTIIVTCRDQRDNLGLALLFVATFDLGIAGVYGATAPRRLRPSHRSWRLAQSAPRRSQASRSSFVRTSLVPDSSRSG